MTPLVRLKKATPVFLVALAVMALAPSVRAQQIQTTDTPGSLGATTTIDGRYLPNPPQPFQGQINLNATQPKPAWPARVVPPKGTLPTTKPLDTVFNIGAASGTPVDDKDYQIPFTFTGKISKLTIAMLEPIL